MVQEIYSWKILHKSVPRSWQDIRERSICDILDRTSQNCLAVFDRRYQEIINHITYTRIHVKDLTTIITFSDIHNINVCSNPAESQSPEKTDPNLSSYFWPDC